MSRTSVSRSRAISSVISAIILSAVVMAIGGAVWAFSQGAMTITAEDYAEAVINMTDTICERFIIEQVYYKYVDESPELHVFVYNYGTVDIEVKVQVKVLTCPASKDDWIKIPSKDMVHFPTIDLNVISKEELNIKAYTKRGNNAYYKYIVP